jgi:hypothetical protein
MPELSVTEEQLERFEALRAELEAAFVDGYGHVRRRDAVDYLLDTYTPPAEQRVRTALDRAVRDEEGDIDYPALQSIARNTDGVKGSGMPAEEMYAAVLEAKVGEAGSGGGVGLDVGHGGGAVPRAESPETDDAPGSDDDGTADAPDGTDTSGEDATGPDGGEDAADADEDGIDERTGTDDGADEAASTGGNAEEGTPSTADGASANGGGSQLQAMMSLLKTHDDKWRKASSGDAPYEVDLPDGGTETARTKDDVKRILFTNY